MHALNVAASTTATIPRPAVKVEAVVASPATELKKSWGIGSRHREHLLGMQQQHQNRAGEVSGPSGELVCLIVMM